jgi:hypothetical protein
MSYLLDAIKDIIKQLKSNPYIIVDEANINEPTTYDSIKNLEMLHKIRFPKNISDFYLSANGLNCKWRISSSLPAKIKNKINKDVEADYDFTKPLGALKILAIEDMLNGKYWVQPFQDETGIRSFEFNNKEYTLGSFAKKLKIFDAYYVINDFECMAFVLGMENIIPEFCLIMLDDYFADWHNSRVVNFETYILAMCKTRFMIPSRRKLFAKYRGDKEPVIINLTMLQDNIEPALFK